MMVKQRELFYCCTTRATSFLRFQDSSMHPQQTTIKNSFPLMTNLNQSESNLLTGTQNNYNTSKDCQSSC